MDIAEFLLARIAEDETAIRNRDHDAPIHYVGCYYYDHSFMPDWTPGHCDCRGMFAGHSIEEPLVRQLAECEAKRRIVGHHARIADPDGDDMGDTCAICCSSGPDAQGWPCDTLKTLAGVYADHPDYDEAWRAT